jgi:predicted O-linked N-acetylglucosamine transferase (SPINDLY family)
VIERFIAQGISAERIVCRGGTSRPDHLAAFGGVDICLDPFPQNGGVSTWEALQMGVPVVAMLGHGSASRIAAAILSSTGLQDWIGDDDAAYHDIAVKFATMPAHLAALRSELPARVAACAAGNPSAYTRSVEDAYRGFWKRYCESSESESASPQG